MMPFNINLAGSSPLESGVLQ